MATIAEMVADVELLVSYASSHKLVLPANVGGVLLGAPSDPAVLVAGSPAQLAFVQAYNDAAAAIGQSPNDLRAGIERRERLKPQLANAQVLLAFAAANGKKVEDGLRNPLVAINTAVADESVTVAHEQEFLKAYEGLTVALAPITFDTLGASQTTLPSWPNLLAEKVGLGKVQRWSFGRFVNVSIFILVLIGTCVSLSYYSQGASALKRYNELQAAITKANDDVVTRGEVSINRIAGVESEKKKSSPDGATIDAAQKAADEAAGAVIRAKDAREAISNELGAIPSRLHTWAGLPCESDANLIFNWLLCSKVDQMQQVQGAAQPGEQLKLVQVEAARTVASRLNDVYLPLLLGWLGAHAFILRSMSKAITERSFASGSAFNHIVRTGLGALAGLASTWLLSSQAVGGTQWANLPVWALGFVAGYGIELVFAFMDRIIGAFTAKP